MRRQIFDTARRRRGATMTRFSLRALVLLALVAICAQAQAQRPSASHSAVYVKNNATADSPHAFKESDFLFANADSGALTLNSISIETLPALGALRVGSTALIDDDSAADNVPYTLAASSINTLTWYPPAGAAAKDSYAWFTFNVTAGGVASPFSAATMNINLLESVQMPATGMPELIAASAGELYDEDILILVNTIGTIMDPNGAPSGLSRLLHTWQQSAAQDGPYFDIPGVGGTANQERNFAPTQAQAGMYVRVCITFDDRLGHEETVCTDGGLIRNVSDAPTGGPSTVSVPNNADSARPHRFARGDFPITADEDGDTINGIRIITTPTAGTLVLVGDADTTIAADTPLSLAQLDTLAYYPADGAPVGESYATFRYRVRDTGADAPSPTQTNPTPAPANEATADATLTINLVESTDLFLRLRLFLEGPLR